MKKRVLKWLALTIVIIWMFSACAAKNKMDLAPAQEGVKKTTESRSPQETPASPAGTTVNDAAKNVDSRMVVRTASLTVRVDNVEVSGKAVMELVKKSGGYIQQANVNSQRDISATYTLRVPEASFMDVIAKIKTLGKVENSTLGGEDITQEYTDNESKLRNYKKTEEQYLEIMKKATTIEDIIKIENELARIREQIELLTGRIKYLKDQASMATIEVQLIEYEGVSESTGPSFGKAFKDAQQGVINSVNMLLKLLALLLVLIGYLIPITPIAALVWYLVKKYNKKRAASVKPNKQKMIPMTDLNAKENTEEKNNNK